MHPYDPALKVPPHSVEAEQSVIGGLLLQPDAYDRISSVVRPADFYNRQNRIIFTAVAGMLAHGEPVDALTLAEDLAATNQLEEAGGQAYIGALCVNMPSAANVRRYAEIVALRAADRNMITALIEAQDLMWEPGETLAKIERAQRMVADIELAKRGSGLVPASEGLIDVMETLRQRVEMGRAPGLSTGFTDLDSRLGGMQSGDLIIIAGRPSMGKSALAVQIAEHVAISGQVAAVFSLEMSSRQLLERAIAGVARVEHTHIRDGSINAEESAKIRDATRLLNGAKLFIEDTPALSATEISARLRTQKRKTGLALGVVDYLQLVPGEGENRNQEMGSITRALKSCAKSLDIPIVLLCQLSRKCEERTDKRPLLSDLRESGEIEQDADIVAMIYRDDYYHPESLAAGTAEIIVRKFRNGATGTTRLTFMPKFVRFENYAGPEFVTAAVEPRQRRQFHSYDKQFP